MDALSMAAGVLLVLVAAAVLICWKKRVGKRRAGSLDGV